jgi:hypothetical protein
VNVRKNFIWFDEKEIDALCNYLPNLQDVLFSGCSLTNSLLQMIAERLKKLRRLKIDNCDGYDNNALSSIALHCRQLESLWVGGSEMTYNTKLSYEGLLVFKKNPVIRLKQLTFNYCSKIGKKAIDVIGDRFRWAWLHPETASRSCTSFVTASRKSAISTRKTSRRSPTAPTSKS